ncbi:MAG: prolipoprotein diacylglyceryl transferase [Planctomycetota bacterium]|nr:prolipoprotein diacylglyceryl transferase [Planctomycetota bacterium]
MYTLAAWFHDWSPFVVRFTDTLGIRWYGLAYALGFFLGWLGMRWLARRGLILVPIERVTDVILAVVVGAVVGGRLGYVAFYQPGILVEFTSSFPYWDLLRMNRGGMASHGGMIGVVIACWWLSRPDRSIVRAREGEPPLRRAGATWHLLDVMALLAPMGLFLGRLANFVNGELLGKVVAPAGEPGPWWAVKFPKEVLERTKEWSADPELPNRLARVLDRVALPGETWDVTYARVLERVQHGDTSLAREIEPLISSRVPSQLLQAAAEGLVLGLALVIVRFRVRQHGVISAWFLIVYGVLRVVTEIWRLPDAHLSVARVAGLSRGQWLSVGMVVLGALLLMWIRVRNRRPA